MPVKADETGSSASLGAAVARGVRELHPAYFALVMATGIVAIAAQLEGMISLIFYRYTFFTFSPSDLMPPYWINMGAVAISTLAGTLLIVSARGTAFLEELLPFLKGFTIFLWATATWWIPMLVTLGFWRHVCKRYKLAYDPLYWGAVFPLGM